MSINSALAAGVTGLVANTSAISAISDNIANANTVGYKQEGVDFASIVTAQAAKGLYSAGGVSAIASSVVSQQGQLNQSASNTDLGINGSGLFITTTDPTNSSATDPRMFTRAGAFTVDSQGYLKNTGSYYLQGWLADPQGIITPNPTDLTQLKTINVLTQGGPLLATTNLYYLLWDYGFGNFAIGWATAAGMLLLAIYAIVAAGCLYVMRRHAAPVE